MIVLGSYSYAQDDAGAPIEPTQTVTINRIQLTQAQYNTLLSVPIAGATVGSYVRKQTITSEQRAALESINPSAPTRSLNFIAGNSEDERVLSLLNGVQRASSRKDDAVIPTNRYIVRPAADAKERELGEVHIVREGRFLNDKLYLSESGTVYDNNLVQDAPTDSANQAVIADVLNTARAVDPNIRPQGMPKDIFDIRIRAGIPVGDQTSLPAGFQQGSADAGGQSC